ncbi:hypothetical protein Nmel_011733 [Mimus melanotis]
MQLWQLLNSLWQDYFTTHIQSHSRLTEGLALGNEKADHFGPLLCPTLISLPKPEGLTRFFIKVQKFYTNNLGYHCRMLKELSQLVLNVRV